MHPPSLATAGLWFCCVACAAPAAQESRPAATPERAAEAERAGEFAQAEALYTVLADRHPTQPRWPIAIARCRRSAARYNDALDLLEKTRQRFPDDAEVASMLASTYHVKAEALLRNGGHDLNVRFQFEEAARVAEAALERHPNHRDLILLMARSHAQLGNAERALSSAREATRRFPGHHGGWILVGDLAYAEYLRHKRRLQQEKPRGQEHADLTALARDAADRAREAYGRVAQLKPDRSMPYLQRGNIEAWAGNVEPALRHYRDALVRAPDVAVDHNWIAQNTSTKRRLQLYEDALGECKTRGTDAKAVATLRWWYAFTLYGAKKYGDACREFIASVEANPKFVNSRSYAMTAAYWHGDADLAEAQAARFAAEAPVQFADHLRFSESVDDSVSILEFLARRAFDGGRPQVSRDINLVLAKLHDTSRHWNNYAFLCRETGAYDRAREAYESALLLDPESPQLLNDSAVVLHYHLPSEANLREAETRYQRAIRLGRAVVEDEEAEQAAKTSARQAIADATSNLAKLREERGKGKGKSVRAPK